MNLLKSIFSELGTSDNYHTNWYGYATNQLSHTLLGFITSCIVSYTTFLILGEFWVKEYIWGTAAILYLFVELIQRQTRNIWDCVEDFIFFAIYGAGSGYLLFDEVTPGSPEIVTNILYTLKVVAIIGSHLLVGISLRLYNAYRSKQYER